LAEKIQKQKFYILFEILKKLIKCSSKIVARILLFKIYLKKKVQDHFFQSTQILSNFKIQLKIFFHNKTNIIFVKKGYNNSISVPYGRIIIRFRVHNYQNFTKKFKKKKSKKKKKKITKKIM